MVKKGCLKCGAAPGKQVLDANLQIVVRWKGHDVYFEGGECLRRAPGDQDIMPLRDALRMSRHGQVIMIGEAEALLASRVVRGRVRRGHEGGYVK